MALNLGGPGWFNDVFEVEITVDTTQRAKFRGLLFQDDCPVYRGDDKLTGVVKVTAPPNCSVWHYGVAIKLDRTTSFFDTMRTIDDEVTTMQLNDGEYVDGTKEYKFEIDLATLEKLADSYDGEMFSVRHGLTAIITRPWYTFDVVRHLSVVIHKVAPAPDDGSLVEPEGPPTPVELQVSKFPRIQITDCPPGECILDYGRSCFNIGDKLQGKLTMKNVPDVISQIQVMFYKIENGDNEENESEIRKHIVYNAAEEDGNVEDAEVVQATAEAGVVDGQNPPPVPTTQAGEEDDEVPPPPPPKPAVADNADDTPPTTPPKPEKFQPKGIPANAEKSFDVEVTLDDTPEVSVTPTYYDLISSAEAISVHYYIRLLIVNTEGKRYWNTHEVIMFRGGLTNLTVIDV